MVFAGSGFAQGAVSPDMKANLFIGMMAWQLAMGSVGVMGWSFYNEAAAGTLENIYLSPLGTTTILLARSVASFLQDLVVMMVSAALAVVTMGIQIDLPLLEIAVLLPMTVAGVYGMGFLFASLTLTFKRTQQFLQIFNFIFMIFTGALVPLDSMHWAMKAVCQMFPMTAGIQALREVTINGARLGDIGGLMMQMTVATVGWLLIGMFVYHMADRRARLRGSIGQY
jgi:ABC-2 type transport system permease protein